MKQQPAIIFEDDQLLVVNKPAGMFSIPDREQSQISQKQWLEHKYGRVFTVHRLDRDTSGVLVFARTEDAHKFLSAQFEDRSTEKIYLAFVNGSMQPPTGRVEAPLMAHPVQKGVMVVNRKGKPSLTEYEVLEDFRRYSYVRFQILTGRTHQVRVHARETGHPVVCDPVYGDGEPVKLSAIKRNFKLSRSEEAETPLLRRMGLHAARLSITHPNGSRLTLEAPLPRDMQALLTQLRKHNAR